MPYKLGQIVYVIPTESNELLGSEDVVECRVEEIWQGQETTITLVPLQKTRSFKVDASEINKTVFDSKVEALITYGVFNTYRNNKYGQRRTRK